MNNRFLPDNNDDVEEEVFIDEGRDDNKEKTQRTK